jgi:trimeric autotransporter adhesin
MLIRTTRKPAFRRPRRAAVAAGTLAAASALIAFAGTGAASAAIMPGAVAAADTTTVMFQYTGNAATWTVPAGITQATFTLYGAEGGTSVAPGAGPGGSASGSAEPGGLGAEVTATIPVTAGAALQVNVGQAGGTGNAAGAFNGGGPGGSVLSGAGGGATDVRTQASDGSYPVANRVLVAGGGGGGAEDGNNASSGEGGKSGSPGLSGNADEAEGLVPGGGGGAGTATGPGAGATGGDFAQPVVCTQGASDGEPGNPGGSGATQGIGGGGGFDGGGGGGGYYGGGGGGQGATDNCGNSAGSGGGGGGSSYTGGVTGATVIAGAAAPDSSTNGEVVITYGTVDTALSYTGATSGTVAGTLSASATLTTTATPPAPVPGEQLTFSVGTSSCTATTTSTGGASCSLTLPAQAGPANLSAAFAGDASFAAASTTATINVTAVPGAPTGLTTTAGDSQVILSWAAPASDGGSPVTGYNIYQGTSAGGESTTPDNSSPVSGTSYTATGLTNGTTYYFVVTAVNAAGEGPQSNEVSATPALIPQTITFTSTPPSPAVYGGSYTPSAAGGNSGHPVTFSIDSSSASGACSISSGTVSFTGTGLCVIDASQAGGSGYAAAQQVQQSFSITPATLAVTPASQSKTYGAADQAFTFTITGFVNGDTSAVVSTQPTCTVAGAHANVGTYTISCSGGAAGGNYVFDDTATATLTVNPAKLTVTASNASRLFGAANPALTATITGFVNGDTSSVVSGSPSCGTTATSSSPGGSYPITCTQGSLAAANYTFAFTPGALTVAYSGASCRTGGHSGGLTVSSGQAVCLGAGYTQNGPVTVASGGALDIEGATLDGPVSVTGATAVRVCGTSLTGPLTVSGSTGLVVIGDDEGPACAGNTITGPVSLTSNSGGVEFDNNTVNGPLTITHTTGTVPPPDTGSLVDVGNKVSGPVHIS